MASALIAGLFAAALAAGAPPDRLWSPDRSRYAVVERGSDTPWACRITIRSAGDRDLSVATAWRIQPDGTGRNAPRECSVRWIDNQRLFCQGSINPSTLVHLLFDASSGSELGEHFGLEFAWSPDAGVLASRGNVPHFMEWNLKSDSLELDGRKVYPVGANHGRLLFHSSLVWSPDSRCVAVVVHELSTKTLKLVLVNRAGSATEHRLPWPAPAADDFPATMDHTVRWNGPTLTVNHAGRYTHSLDIHE